MSMVYMSYYSVPASSASSGYLDVLFWPRYQVYTHGAAVSEYTIGSVSGQILPLLVSMIFLDLAGNVSGALASRAVVLV